jgi:Ca2+-binding EF-hand superfamily protein
MLGGIGNSTQMMSQLFSRLDSKGQGYLEKSDLASAFSQIAAKTGGSSDSSSVDQVFAALDNDSDGKVTQSEFSSTLSKLQEQLDSQFNQMRMQGGGHHGGPQGMSNMPPPPPPQGQDSSGFSKDELQSQLQQIGSSDSQRASLISNIVNNFDKADTDGDGKVSFTEAMAYDQSSQSTSSTSSTSATATSSSTTEASSNSDAAVLRKIMELMHAYGNGSGEQSNQASAVASLLSITA